MKLFNLFAIIATTANAMECEVCNTFLGKVEKAIAEENITGNDEVEKKVRAMCKDAKDQDNRFCYYTGLTADAATTMHKVLFCSHNELFYLFPKIGCRQPTWFPQASRQNLCETGQKGQPNLRAQISKTIRLCGDQLQQDQGERAQIDSDEVGRGVQELFGEVRIRRPRQRIHA